MLVQNPISPGKDIPQANGLLLALWPSPGNYLAHLLGMPSAQNFLGTSPQTHIIATLFSLLPTLSLHPLIVFFSSPRSIPDFYLTSGI